MLEAMYDLPAIRAALIKSQAAMLGFDYCGIAEAVRLEDDARRLEQWLTKGMHGSMSYMERNFDLRIDPTRLVPGARSVVTLLLNHFPKQAPRQTDLASHAMHGGKTTTMSSGSSLTRCLTGSEKKSETSPVADSLTPPPYWNAAGHNAAD